MREDLMLNVANFEATEENYDSLREAVQRLSSASEEQFESIKKEKWYNRVFDMVTFSQKGKKRLAEQIGTVAQAQQILLELLLRLSANDTKVSELVLQNKSSIERIQEQNIYLLSRIKRLENVALGIKKDTDISTLSAESKELLCAIIYYINQKYEGSSEEQKNFANAILNYIDVADVQMDNPFAKLGNLDNESKRKILACCMEYMFLKECTEDCIEEYEDVLDEFDYGRKTLKEISTQIQAIYNLRGAEGFYTKYQSGAFEDFDSTFYVDFLEEEESVEEPVEIEDYVINSMLHIGPGENMRFDYKNIHINSYITCEGTLEFHNCVITYNEGDSVNQINLSGDARLGIFNSSVICKGLNKNFFISGEDIIGVWVEKSTLIDCYKFAHLRRSKFILRECELQNCYYGILDMYLSDTNKCVIANNVIKEIDIPEFLKGPEAKKTGYRLKNSMISTCSYVSEDNEEFCCEAYDNMIITEKGLPKDLYDFDEYHFEGNNMLVSDCTFNGTSHCVKAYQIENCKFENCSNVIETTECSMEYGINVLECAFIGCTAILELARNSNVKNCQFVECTDALITLDFCTDKGGINVEFCEFINIKTESVAALRFGRGKSSASKENRVSKCIFNGVELGEAFLIEAVGYEKPSGTVTWISECEFRNCSTKRSSGKIIKEYMTYDTLILKNQEFHANVIRDCRGLDKVNKENKRVEESAIKVKSTDSSGKTIGAVVKTAVGGAALAIGAPLPIAIVAGVNAVKAINKSNENNLHRE